MYKLSVQGRAWCVTVWNRPERERFAELIEEGTLGYIVVGEETCPRTGKLHWHIYLEMAKKTTMNRIKAIVHDNTAHIERRLGDQQSAINYAKKDGLWWELGTPVQQGKRNDLEDCKQMLKEGKDLLDVAEKHFGDFVRYNRGLALYKDLLDRRRQKESPATMPEVIVYVGRSGTGKSHHCANDELFRESGYRYLQQMEGKVYFDGYDGQKCLWFDEFSGKTMRFTDFCRIADKWGTRVETMMLVLVISQRCYWFIPFKVPYLGDNIATIF